MGELIAGRARHLADADRLLLEQVYLRNTPARELSVAMGCSDKALRSRIRVLVARVLHPAFPIVILLRDHWPPRLARLATLMYVQGLSCRAAAADLRVSYSTARHERDAVLALVNAELVRGHVQRAGATP